MSSVIVSLLMSNPESMNLSSEDRSRVMAESKKAIKILELLIQRFKAFQIMAATAPSDQLATINSINDRYLMPIIALIEAFDSEDEAIAALDVSDDTDSQANEQTIVVKDNMTMREILTVMGVLLGSR